MNRRSILALAAGGSLASIAGCSALPDEAKNQPMDDPNESPNESPDDGPSENPDPDPQPTLQNTSFEEGLTGWTTGKDLPDEPGESEEKIEHQIEVRGGEEASDGEQSLYLFLDGSADDGTVWVEQEMDFADVDEIKFDVYSAQKSFNIITEVAFFAGEKPDGGLQERDFDRNEDVQDHGGWKTYTYDVSSLDGAATLAVGMNIVWETGYGTYYDNIRAVSSADN